MKNVTKLNIFPLEVILLLMAFYSICTAVTPDKSRHPVEKSVKSVQTQANETFPIPDKDLRSDLTCLPGKDCKIEVQNINQSYAYQSIWFEVEYMDKIKRGKIDDILPPQKAAIWSIGLVFTELPKDIKVRVLTAEAGDPLTLAQARQERKKRETAMAASEPAKILPTSKHFISMRFFESGYNSLPYNERTYKKEFAAPDIRYINWELNLQHPAPGTRIEYDVEALWKNANASIFNRQSLHTHMAAAWRLPYTTYSLGNKAVGTAWQPGTYTVELYIGSEKIATETFKVY